MRRNGLRFWRGAAVGLAIALLALAAANAMSQEMGDGDPGPRKLAVKPKHTVIGSGEDRARIEVKFVDGLRFDVNPAGNLIERPRNGLRNQQSRATLASIKHDGGLWHRMLTIPEEVMDEFRGKAERRLRQRLSDMNSYYVLNVPVGESAEEWIDILNTLPEVEIARPAKLPAPPPVPGDFQPLQGYLNAATGGIDASSYAWFLTGGTGANVRICDLEYSWNTSHQDLPAVTTLIPAGRTAVDPFDTNHGTAVLGELCSLNNGWGTTGITYGAQIFVAPTNWDTGYNLAAAIINALLSLSAGDFLLIEQQTAGPNYVDGSGSQDGLVPSEWDEPVYDAIVTAVGLGVHVVEAAGNGAEDLDDPVYSSGNGGHYPFNGSKNSGAIIVGAGFQPGGGSTDRSRIDFSNYGSRVDVQGWGDGVMTTGYGTYYNAEGMNLWYRGNFAGTSSASPIVTGAAALIESIEEALHPGSTITPAAMRSVLIATGSPQQAGMFPVSEHIGPRPSIRAAVQSLDPCVLTCPAPVVKSNDAGQCGAVVNYPAATASATCGTLTYAPPSGSFFPVGITPVQVTTLAGSSCAFTVTVNDTEPPLITCPADIVVGTDPGYCSAVVTFAATASDNCSWMTVTTTPASGSIFPKGTTTVTCTAVDAAGNSASCTFTVTVNDTEPPVAICPSDMVLNTEPGRCDAVATFTATATDNCPGVTVSCVPPSGSVFPKGTTTVTCTAVDAVGNSATCSFTVTVEDHEPPTISVVLSPTVLWPPNHKLVDITATVTTTDNCPDETYVLTSITSDEPDNGLGDGDMPNDIQIVNRDFFKLRAERAGIGDGRVYTATYTVTDASGNTASESAIVSVPHDAPAKVLAEGAVPERFRLAQNYPNPFNPTTIIGFDIPEAAVVTLRVFDLLGREVAAPVSGELLDAGGYTVLFDGARIGSGVYTYSITAVSTSTRKEFVDTKKMVLMK